jgi:hypothetical protein
MQSVYGFDCYEASNNAVEDIEETRESLLDSAYALTPAEERELEAEEVRGRVLWCHCQRIVLTTLPRARLQARKPTKVPEGAYAGVGVRALGEANLRSCEPSAVPSCLHSRVCRRWIGRLCRGRGQAQEGQAAAATQAQK